MHSQNPWQEQRSAAGPSHFRSRLLHHLTRHWSNQPRALARTQKFLGYYRPYLPLLLADLLCAALVAATAIALPLCASYITTRLPELAQADNGLSQILLMGGAMLVIWFIQAMATYFVDYQGHVMGARIEADVRKELFEHCQKLSFSFYDRQRVGQLMSRISNDSLWLGELFHHGPEDLAIGLLKFVGAMVVLVIIDPVLAGLIVLLLPPAGIYARHFNRHMHVALKTSKERIAAVNEQVEDTLGGVRVVQSFANEAEELRRFETENRAFFESRRQGYRSEAMLWTGMDGFAQLVTILVIVAGAMRILTADLTVAEVLTFLLCVGVLVDPVRRLDNFIRLWQEGATGFTRAMELLEERPDIVDAPGATDIGPVKGAIGFHNVRFAYGEGHAQVFDGLSFHIRPGEFVALVGASGVGKSTLCALIPRFYDVTEGSITLDGHDVRDVTLASLRRSVGVVQQDVYLFSGTVEDNLRYGRPGATDDEIIAAAKAANAHDFIMRLPDGYRSDVGQRGVKLSGGQKQRLTIARAFLKNPGVLIFDEATSALDNESERAVQQALLTLSQGRTTIVIAHRLSTVRHADRILVLTPDGIGEEGTHDQLMQRDGLYAGLHKVSTSF